MAVQTTNLDDMPVVSQLEQFDPRSGSWLERLIFNNRRAAILICALVTFLAGYFIATKLVFNASFEKMIPQGHPYIKNYLEYKNELPGLGNAIRIVVENPDGDIYDAKYLETLKQITDDLSLMSGVDRAWVKSLWMPSVRWTEVTEEGYKGGPVVSESYDGSVSGIEELRANVAKSATAQNLVAANQRSSMIVVPLLETNSETGKRLDYWEFSRRLEQQIRAKYEMTRPTTGIDNPQSGGRPVSIRIIGFAKLVGDLIEGMVQVAAYFGAAVAISAVIIFYYTRCVRSTTLVIACSVVAVIWQLGCISALGFEIDPYSVLVPFLIFAIGVSHGAQKMNGIMQDIGRGTHRLVAARYTFRRLFLAGLTALLADAVSFAVLMVIDIPVIRHLALAASVGVGILIFTNLVLLPVILSYTGVGQKAAVRSLSAQQSEKQGKGAGKLWALLDNFTQRKWALPLLVFTAFVTAIGFVFSLKLQIGDLDAGAPELRPESRYNRDNDFITKNFALSSDQFAVIVKTPRDGCLDFKTMQEVDRLGWELQQAQGVQTTISLSDALRLTTSGSYEGSPKWQTISRNQDTINYAGNQALMNNPDLTNRDCSVLPVVAYLTDHRADTLGGVLDIATDFAEKHSTDDRRFLLAAGSAGIEAATNIVVKNANHTMLYYVYAAVIALCVVTFRSWRAVIVAVIPLLITSILCEVLMVALGLGVKVATLPVVALGVGIGVDYALYLLSVQLAFQRQGLDLASAYKKAVQFTGRVVALVGCTLGAAVFIWAWSPIKFQADMGILLAFMFIWNMFGALVLTPALSHFLLNPKASKA